MRETAKIKLKIMTVFSQKHNTDLMIRNYATKHSVKALKAFTIHPLRKILWAGEKNDRKPLGLFLLIYTFTPLFFVLLSKSDIFNIIDIRSGNTQLLLNTKQMWISFKEQKEQVTHAKHKLAVWLKTVETHDCDSTLNSWEVTVGCVKGWCCCGRSLWWKKMHFHIFIVHLIDITIYLWNTGKKVCHLLMFCSVRPQTCHHTQQHSDENDS